MSRRGCADALPAPGSSQQAGVPRLDLFGARRLPYLSRPNYQLEIRHLLLWGIFAGMVEGNVCAVIASKTFNGSNFLITFITATPMFANLVSLAWGFLSRGRRQQLFLSWLAAAAVVSAGSIGITPRSAWGGWMFAVQIALARVFVSGVVTVRTSLWKNNYPQRVRGMITGRLQFVRAAMGVLSVATAGLIFDRNPQAYHWLFPTAAAIGLIAAWIISRTRVRGEKAALRAQRARSVSRDDSDTAETSRMAPFDLVAELSPLYMVREMARVLREDRMFARYCGAQMALGISNIMIQPILPILFTKRLNFSYFVSGAMLDLLPNLLLLVTLSGWGRLFDRVGVIRMRVLNTWLWVASMSLATAAAFAVRGAGPLSPGAFSTGVGLFLVARMLYGVSMSGGAIAWHIGHLHFAGPHDDQLYMGIHVSLTGVRGLIAPFVGLWLHHRIDWGVFAVAVGVLLLSVYQFTTLARDMPRQTGRESAHPA